MKPPDKPKEEDCCGSGCNPCIFDVYEKKLERYRHFLQNGMQADTDSEQKTNALSQIECTLCTLVENYDLNNSYHLLKFKLSNGNSKSRIWWNPGDHFLFKYDKNETACTRSYSPLDKYCLSTGKEVICCADEFLVIVRKYSNGFVSKYLCDLTGGDTSLWRGPYGHYEYVSNKFTRIIMIAQGTGIVPFVSIIKKILNDEEDMTKIVLYYCCNNSNSILVRQELFSYQSLWNFTYKVFLSEPAYDIKYNEPIENCKLNEAYIKLLSPFLEQDQLLICGSKPFMETYKQYLLGLNATELNIIKF